MLMRLSRRWQTLKSWLDAGLSFLYPEVCQNCNKTRATAGNGYICDECGSQAAPVVPPFCERCGLPFAGKITTEFECSNCRGLRLHFSFARSAVGAEGIVLDLIHRYKYDKALWVEPFLAGLLIERAATELREGRWNMIAPIPLHPTKEREREFNQAARLGQRLSDACGIPLRTDFLRRVRPTESQTSLTRRKRDINVRKAFALKSSSESLNGKRIVLIDDVFTTGATSNACARLLRRAGARDVCVWTVARGLFN